MKLKTIPNFTFDEASHTYQLDGKLLTGTTTVLKCRSEAWLEFWRAKAMYNALLPQLERAKMSDQFRWEYMLDEAKNAGSAKSKEALESGKIAHTACESWIQQRIAGVKQPILAPITDEGASKAFEQFKAWEEAHTVQWLYSEIKLCSAIHSLAGTVDFIAMIDGVLTIGDFKTSNQISQNVCLQTASYQILVEENLEEGEAPKQRCVIRIPKNGDGFEYQVIQTDINFDKEIFLALRQVHRWEVYIQNNFTEGTNKYDTKIKLNKQNANE